METIRGISEGESLPHSSVLKFLLLSDLQTVPWNPADVRKRRQTWTSLIIRDQEWADICLIIPVTAARHTGWDQHRTFQEYKGCPERIQPFWISREPFAWPWCNLVASERRPYCASVKSHSSVGLVSRQWDSVDWACLLCDRRIHNDRSSRSASSQQCVWPFYSCLAGFCQIIASCRSVSSPIAQNWPPATSFFSQS